MYKLTDALSNMASIASLQASYWNMYMGVLLAFLTFLLNSWDKEKNRLAVTFLAMGLCAFFISNLSQIYGLQERYDTALIASIEFAKANADQIPPEFLGFLVNRPSMRTAPYLALVHVIVDLGLIGLLVFNYRRNKANPQSK
jgi:hypothetical protein